MRSIALFSLGWHELVPVDTHVYQIAIRDYSFPGSRATAVTPLINARVADKLRAIWGPYAGWCQQVLFFEKISASAPGEAKKRKAAVKAEVKEEEEEEEEGKPVVRKLTFEEEVQALMEQPGAKRRRTAVQVKVEEKVPAKKGGQAKKAVQRVEEVVAEVKEEEDAVKLES